jgi:hypothetical protein
MDSTARPLGDSSRGIRAFAYGVSNAGKLCKHFEFCFQPREWLVHGFKIHKDKRMVREYIPFMNEQERAIIAYLLARNEKTFEADSDGRRAASLLSHGIV